MRNLQDIRAQVAGTLADIDTLINADQASSPSVIVKPGDNLGFMLEVANPDTIFRLTPDYRYEGDIEFKRPCTLTHVRLEDVPLTRPDETFLNVGTIKGHLTVSAPRVRFVAVRLDCQSRDRNAVEVYGPDCLFDRTVVQATPTGGRRGIFVGAGAHDFIARKTHVGGFWHDSYETQAISAVGDAQRGIVDTCKLEASGENFMMGGGTIGSEDRICSDWQLLDSHLFKPLAWRTNGAAVKNLLELKAVKNFQAVGNLLENHWVGAQSGFAVVMTVRNQNNVDPWSTIRNVMFEDNIIRSAPAGFNILGLDDETDGHGGVKSSTRMENVTLTGTRMQDMSGPAYGGNGRTFQIQGGPKNLIIDGLIVAGGAGRFPQTLFMTFGQHEHQLEGFIVRNVEALEGEYGVHSSEFGLGARTLEGYAPGYVWENVTMKLGGERYIEYPAGTIRVL